MQILRKLTSISRRDHIHNEKVRQHCNIKEKNEAGYEWNDHVSRMVDYRLTKIARENGPAERDRQENRGKDRKRTTTTKGKKDTK